jgi:hypothetical protein
MGYISNSRDQSSLASVFLGALWLQISENSMKGKGFFLERLVVVMLGKLKEFTGS